MSKKSKRVRSPSADIPSPVEGKSPAAYRQTLPYKFFSVFHTKGITWMAALLLLVSVLFYYASIDYDYDLWFHLKYGEQYIKDRTWHIDHTQFSWTPVDTGWKYVTWIGSSLLYIVYQAGSVTGLYIMMWLILVLVSGLVLSYAKAIGSAPDIRHVAGLILVTAVMAPTVTIIKPELFTILCFSFAVFVYFYSRSGKKDLFPVYPVLFLIWVNTHGGFIFGLFFVTLMLCGELFSYFLTKKEALPKSLLQRFGITVILSYLATLANPHGITYHAALFHYLTSDEYIGLATHLQAYSDLWQVLFPKIHAFRPMVSAWSMLAMLAIFLLVFIQGYRKQGRFEFALLITNLTFFFIGMGRARASIFFPLLWVFSMVYLLKKSCPDDCGKKSQAAAFLLVICLSGIFFSYYAAYSSRSWFGAGMDDFIPAKEVMFIKNNTLPGPVFNDYLTGGYMIWTMHPDYKVFIDPRYGPYVNTVLPVWLRIRSDLTPESLKRFSSVYPFSIALIGLEEIEIISWLLKSPDWKLAYFDKAAVVIVHRTVFDAMNPDSLRLDLGTGRFRGIANPRVLLQLFNLYINLRTEYAREMMDIYRENVSDFYRLKEETVFRMGQLLHHTELQLQQHGRP